MSCPLAVINPAAFEGAEDLTYGDAFKTASYGTGPYMYSGDCTDGVYTFVRNPYYWGEAPEVDIFKVKVIEDNDAKLLALRNGEIDAIVSTKKMSFDGYSELSSDSAFGSSMNEDATLTRYLGMNVTTAPFNDLQVRQAVAYAIDQSRWKSLFSMVMRPQRKRFFRQQAILQC
jgi:nickel transport system substrate-binding protein